MFCLIFLLGHIVPVTELMARPGTPTPTHYYYCQFNSQSEHDRSWVSSCHAQQYFLQNCSTLLVCAYVQNVLTFITSSNTLYVVSNTCNI